MTLEHQVSIRYLAREILNSLPSTWDTFLLHRSSFRYANSLLFVWNYTNLLRWSHGLVFIHLNTCWSARAPSFHKLYVRRAIRWVGKQSSHAVSLNQIALLHHFFILQVVSFICCWDAGLMQVLHSFEQCRFLFVLASFLTHGHHK